MRHTQTNRHFKLWFAYKRSIKMTFLASEKKVSIFRFMFVAIEGHRLIIGHNIKTKCKIIFLFGLVVVTPELSAILSDLVKVLYERACKAEQKVRPYLGWK